MVRRPVDVIVVGLGAYGSAAAFHLAAAGARVFGVERGPHPAHKAGSSHGHSRITRLGYREGAQYVPLLQRSLALFKELGSRSGLQLFSRTGVLEVGNCTAALATVREHGLPHELLTGLELNRRFLGWRVPEQWQALFQPDGGILVPEACIQAHCDGAVAAGAELLWQQSVRCWKAERAGGVTISLDDGTAVHASKLLLAAGSWMPDLVPELKALVTPVRQVVGWFHTSSAHLYQPQHFPVFILDVPQNTIAGGIRANSVSNCWYGFPEFGPQPGLKIGLYNHLNQAVHPAIVDRSLSHLDEAALRAPLQQYIPAANGPLLMHSVCLFTNTEDGHFIIDRHPAHPHVWLCSACSGHGFKMSSGVGQLLAWEMLGEGAEARHIATSRPWLQELALHRIQPQARVGHAAFTEACTRKATST